MTSSEELVFIRMWQQGASYRELAQALGCPLGTVASRSAALAAQGKIHPRRRGGAYSSRRAKAQAPLALSDTNEPGPVHTPVQDPVQISAPHTGTVHTSVQTSPDHAPPSPDLSGVLNALVERLSAIEETLKHGGVQKYTPV
jgi:DNA-binding transcriptional MocR family regulator